LPLEIITDKGKEKIMVSASGIMVNSASLPLVDPDMYYLRKILYE
jgi:hypothetical protein